MASYRQQMGLKAVLAVKQLNTTVPIKEHKKYNYKLRGLDILHANQVWSTDITYIKTKEGMVYLAAIAGSRYFCESLFWASQPKQAAKT